MPRKSAFSVVTALLLVTAALSIAASAAATSMRALDTRALVLESSEIVIGTVVDVRSRWDAGHTRILTDIDLDVSQTLAGDPASKITLTQYGGEVDGVRVSVPGGPLFRPGEEALLFVWRDAHGRAQVNGLAQGKFDISRDPVTGAASVERTVPGFAARDARSLGPVPSGQTAAKLSLDDLVREIHAALRTATPGSDR